MSLQDVEPNMKSTETVEKGIIVSEKPRKIVDYGNSKAVTLDPRWLRIQKWLGKEVTELISVANSIVILAPPDKKEHALEVLRRYEAEMEALKE